ncbi:MAG: polysaccharide deacetylase family protein [Usitatibacteraceae bacterium]
MLSRHALRFAKRALGFAACIFAVALLSPIESIAKARASASTISPDRPVEIHQRLVTRGGENIVALTLDACGGGFDAALVAMLIELRVPATIFATRKWIDRHPEGMALLNAHPELFIIEDHGAAHVPAVIGVDKRVYGLRSVPDLAHLHEEVDGGARAIAATGAPRPQWYRGATAIYDRTAMAAIEALGYRIAGFSVNADAGATLPRREIVARLGKVKAGDIIIAHMNKPASESAEALRDALPVLLRRGVQFVTVRGRAVEKLG